MLSLTLLFIAGILAGAMNAVAGGGSFISFPALVYAGVPSINANASSTVALIPGSISSVWKFRDLIRPFDNVSMASMVALTLVGGFAGAVLLLYTPSAGFDALVPWLLLTGSLAFAFGRQAGNWLRSRIRIGPVLMLTGQFFLGVYGGYFGGAVGIMMMAFWMLMGLTDIRMINANKTLFVGIANSIAVVIFIVAGKVYWLQTGVMMVATFIGGYGGAVVTRVIEPERLRKGIVIWNFAITLAFFLPIKHLAAQHTITITTPKMTMVVDYGNKASITSLMINGQKVIGTADGMYTTVKIAGETFSSLHPNSSPVATQTADKVKISGISYGPIEETWTFTKKDRSIQWDIERTFSTPAEIQEAAMPVMNFDDIKTWDAAYQGYGGVAWFYLFNEKQCTYGIHTNASAFWNSTTDNGLDIKVDAPGQKVAMRYTRTPENRLSYAITTSADDLQLAADSGTNRRRFITTGASVWAPFRTSEGKTSEQITFSYFSFEEKYGRGKLTGINSSQVNAVLNTIARMGVIDSLHFGGNSWHTPYGPICLHEQYIAQLGLGIDDPHYLKGYQSCLDFYRDHAIKPDGRVYPRWAYTNEDAMPGQFNKEGFYEAQWGFLLDSNPDYVSDVSDLFDLTGDMDWVKGHRLSCEKALDWILKRDSNNNGLVEMTTDSHTQKRGSDWIDIIWASYENAFVNAKLYYALIKWAAIEKLLQNNDNAIRYEKLAARLKASFNKSTKDGGFWDEEKACYVHWRDKDNSIHGRNMVTPVNFMAIAYGICDDTTRKKRILDGIENQMQQEHLFFWPLTMRSYEPGEGNDWQFPFPNYENGDLFLSWGSIGVKAYAGYDPSIAMKYVKNVLAQYAKDGLAFQRYGRQKQDGLGDDILSGNSLAIIGLYQSVYGINPLYNRFYLEPHLTPELAGTQLRYNYHDQRLTIDLENNTYAVSNGHFKIVCDKPFGFNATKDHLLYFNGSNPVATLQVIANIPLTLMIASAKESSYRISGLEPEKQYMIGFNKKAAEQIKSDKNGSILVSPDMSEITITSR